MDAPASHKFKSDPKKLLIAVKGKQLHTFWQRHPPSKDDKILAFQLTMDTGVTTDEQALSALNVFLDKGFKFNSQIGPVRQTLPVMPCTALQGALIRPVVLQRLLESTPVALNEKQLGYDATLLHIICHLYHDPPGMMTDEGSKKGPARKRLLESARLLLAAGADPFVPDNLGSPPLFFAAQAAAVTADTALVELLFDAMYGGGQPGKSSSTSGSGAQEFATALKLKPDKLIQELNLLAKQAKPVAAAMMCNADEAATGCTSGSSKTLQDVFELPPEALRRARMLLTVAEIKLSNFDQLLELLPLAGVAELFQHILLTAQQIAGKHTAAAGGLPANTISKNALAARLMVRACDLPMSSRSLKAWCDSMKSNPKQLLLYAMLRWNTTLHRQLLSDRELRKAATQGAKALIEYAQAIIATAGSGKGSSKDAGSSSRSNSRQSAAAVILKKRLPAFEDMAFTTTFLVSWMVIQARINDVPDRPELFEPLGRETGHHEDLLTLLGMGHANAVHAARSLCTFPEVAVDTLLRLSEDNCSNDVAAQLAAIINKITKRVSRGKDLDQADLRAAIAAVGLMGNITSQLFELLQGHSNQQVASQLFKQALPAMATLKGTEVAAALAAAEQLPVEAFRAHAALPGVLNYTSDCRIVLRVIEWAASPETYQAVAAAAGAQNSSSTGSGASSSRGAWTEELAEQVLLAGIKVVAAGQAAAAGMPSSAMGQSTIQQLLSMLGMPGPTAFGSATPAASQVLRDLTAATQQSGLRPITNSACWGCGRSAEEAAAAGVSLQRGADGKPKLKCCSRCHTAYYCSADCQLRHWKAHKPTCVAKAK